jgi:hypothetical protein
MNENRPLWQVINKMFFSHHTFDVFEVDTRIIVTPPIVGQLQPLWVLRWRETQSLTFSIPSPFFMHFVHS